MKKFPTLDELVSMNTSMFNGELERNGVLKAIKLLEEEKKMFSKKVKELEESTEQLNDYDNSTKNDNSTEVDRVRLFFKGKVSWWKAFGSKTVEYDVKINDTMLWSIISYMLDEKRHFENCVKAIDIVMEKISIGLKE